MGLSICTSSCEDMLTPELERHQDTPAQDTLYTYWGILKSLQGIAERYVILGECRGDLVSGSQYVSDSINSICDFEMDKATDGSCRYLKARDYYQVINSCNCYLAYADTNRVTGTNEKYMIREYAQVEAIRAWVYLQLVQVYGEVPFYLQPMTTTADIDAFISNPSSQTANRNNLPDLLGPKLEQVAEVMLPNYDMYGIESDPICHSLYCMFPVNLVLGDIYLFRGEKADCAKAAEYYYKYLEDNKAVITNDDILAYYCTGRMNQVTNMPYYYINGERLFTRTSAPTASSKAEIITVIPSNKNKLTGSVQRGIQSLFGFIPTISVADTSSNATINLTLNFEKELDASAGYLNLCKAQQYEEYIGQDYDNLTSRVVEGIGDARQAWADEVTTTINGGNSQQGRFVMKQNPSMQFTSMYPIIYRKGNVWLRFAEAINRAGFPGYAFAVLKDGLCNNSLWFADNASQFQYDEYLYFARTDKDSTYRDRQELLDEGLTLDSIGKEGTETNSPDSARQALIICNYISYKEFQDAKTTSYLNFRRNSFTGGSGRMITYRRSAGSMDSNMTNKSFDGGASVGIHSRGCGVTKPYDRQSTFNFADAVKKKNPTLTDPYDLTKKEEVIEAVEELIIDEMALETAFEGNRFFDLMRVALRRNDPDFLAKKVASRKGYMDENLRHRLQTTSNWYFKLPNH